MRTPEQLRARRTRRKVARYNAKHPPTQRSTDPLRDGLAFLVIQPGCDGSTKRQGRLSE